MEAKPDASHAAIFNPATVRGDVVAGLVSSTVAIPLAMAFGMFAFVTLGDEYFAYGAMAGLMSAFVAGVVCVVLGDRSTRLYAPRITTTFFLGLLLTSLLHRDVAGGGEPSVPATLLVFFAIILLGGIFQGLFGVMRLGTLIKFAPHPVMAGFQNMAAVLLFLVQLGNVLGFDHNVRFTRVFGALDEARPLSFLVAVLTFAAMWNARRITTKLPPMLVGLGCGALAYYALVVAGFGESLGPIIGSPTASAAMRTVLVDFSGLAMAAPLEQSWPLIVSSALALAIIASIDALLCAKLASRPGELRAGDDRLLVRLGIANAISAAFGGITSGINIGPSLANRAFGAQSPLSVLVNAASVLAAATLLFPLLAYIPRAVLSAAVMVIAIQHIEPWTRQLAMRLITPGTPQRGAIALDLGVCLFVSLLSIAVNVVLAVFIGIVLAVFLFVVRMSRSNIRKLYRCDNVRSRRYRDPAELEVLHAQGASVLVIELQGALFFGSAERLAQIVDRETAQGTKALLLEMRRITEIDSTGARILGDIDAALAARGVKLALVLSARTETAARLADIFHAPDRFFPDIDRAIEWAEDDLLRADARNSAMQSENGRSNGCRWSAISPRTKSRDYERGSSRWRGRPERWCFAAAIPARRSIWSRKGAPASTFCTTTATSGWRRSRPVRCSANWRCSIAGRARPPSPPTRISRHSASARHRLRCCAQQQPDLAIKLLTALGRELSVRIRYANMTIQQLET